MAGSGQQGWGDEMTFDFEGNAYEDMNTVEILSSLPCSSGNLQQRFNKQKRHCVFHITWVTGRLASLTTFQDSISGQTLETCTEDKYVKKMLIAFDRLL